MRPDRTFPLAPLSLAVLAALASGCVEKLVDTGSGPLVEEDADTGQAYGDPLADGAGEVFDSIVHPVRGRIDLTILATGPLSPNVGVALTVSGVAQEAIDSGEVVLTLPTRALMDHAGGKGLPDLPVKARWDLPPMAEGDTWSGSYTVPGEAAGYYRVMANAYTHGPDGGAYLFDEALGEAWMHVSETDGQLARFFEDSISPPLAGPAAGWPTGGGAWTVSRPDSNSTNWHPDSVFLAVVYTVSEEQGFKPAVGATVEARWHGLLGPTQPPVITWTTVPEDGIVALLCRTTYLGQKRPREMWGNVHAFDTELVQGRSPIARWRTDASHCGTLVEVEVLAHRYYPWRLLNLAADTLQKHFGHTRGRIDWNLRWGGGSSYNGVPGFDKITLNWRAAASSRFFWTVAHEYGHALHHKALGGIWWRSPNCNPHSLHVPSSYKCALKEGFADYAGTVGSGGYREACFERFGEPENEEDKRDEREPSCKIESDRKAEVEGYVAALFMDLIDDTDERGDWTEYSGHYVARVFKTCEAKGKFGWLIPNWRARHNVSDIVWCLENYIEPAYHDTDSVFDGLNVPDDIKHDAKDPPNWNPADIRLTWLKNLN